MWQQINKWRCILNITVIAICIISMKDKSWLASYFCYLSSALLMTRSYSSSAMRCNLLRTCVYDHNVNARCWHTSLICNCSDQSIRPIRRSKCTHWYRFECLMHTYSSQIWARFQSRLSGRLACRQFDIYSSRIGVADSIYYTRSIELCRI